MPSLYLPLMVEHMSHRHTGWPVPTKDMRKKSNITAIEIFIYQRIRLSLVEGIPTNITFELV